MPELPEVETTRLSLLPHVTGQIIAQASKSRHFLRKTLTVKEIKVLQGQKITHLTRRAKYLLFHLAPSAKILVVHLGMTGTLRAQKTETPQKHDHLVFILKNKKRIIFHDPRRFGMVFLIEAGQLDIHAAFARLGPEPFSDAFTPEILAQALAHKKQPIKQTLLDQRVVVGVGNIYASEALYRARISPLRAAGTLTRPEITKLYKAIIEVLQDAIQAGGSSIRDFKAADGQQGYFAHQFDVYGRAGEGCAQCTCRQKIQKIVQNGRSSFYCPQKQR